MCHLDTRVTSLNVLANLSPFLLPSGVLDTISVALSRIYLEPKLDRVSNT